MRFQRLSNLLLICLFPLLGNAQGDSSFPLKITLYAKANTSTKIWKEDIKKTFSNYPEFNSKFGYGAGLDIHVNLSDNWYLANSVDFTLRKNGVSTGGVIQFFDEMGNPILIQCDEISQKINQGILAIGAGYKLFPFLAIELAPYAQWDLTKEEFKFCDYNDWKENEFFEKNFDIGFVPSLRLSLNNFNLKFSYLYGLGNAQKIKLTDENGHDVGEYNTGYRMFSMGIGYTFL
ncbi:MAG: hypothetical protein WAT79_16570 [Saprospiraceae bacterium]